MEYAIKVKNLLEQQDIRVELDDRDEKLSYRMRESQTKKIPYTLILGDKERDNEQISYRVFGQTDTTTLSIQEFVQTIKDVINNKKAI